MAKIVETRKFQCTELDKSATAAVDRTVANQSNKSWLYEVYDDGTVIYRHGKTGSALAVTGPKQMGSVDAALKDARKKAKKKMEGKLAADKVTRHSIYTEVKVHSATPTTTASGGSKNSANLGAVAESEIEFKSPEVRKLVRHLAKVNRHQIMTATKGLTYDDKTGLFSTPLGVVTRDVVVDARDVLVELADMVAADDHKRGRRDKNDAKYRKFVGALQRYMTLIPTDIGYKSQNPWDILPHTNRVQQWNGTLDSLDASLDMLDARKNQAAKAAGQKVGSTGTFDVRIEVVGRDEAVWRLIEDMYSKSMNRSHQCSHLKVARVLRIRIGDMNRGFEEDGAALENIWQLWHGTRSSNLLSILAKGFYIPPANAAHCTGRMFGNGVYFSDQSTKALNYAYGYWDKQGNDNNPFMLLCDVAMGNIHRPSSYSSSMHDYCKRNGFDSCFAEGGKAGVANNEMIAYRLGQINPRFIVQFSPTGQI